MSLPRFNQAGDLPPSVYRATLDEVLERFGAKTGKRGVCTRCLVHIYQLAQRTGKLQRFVIFGSYITRKRDPKDVDVILVMDDGFRLEECPIEAQGLFDHAVAQARYGASIFWIRPAVLTEEKVDDFLAYWQLKRDGSQRGIVEVISEP